MSYFNFPHSRTYDSDLGWLIKALREYLDKVNELVELNSLKIADPINWNITTQYPRYTIVINSDGMGYISRIPVPEGIALTNTTYWLQIFDFSTFYDKVDDLTAALNAAVTTLQANIAAEAAAREAADQGLQSNINTETTDRQQADIGLQQAIAQEAQTRNQQIADIASVLSDLSRTTLRRITNRKFLFIGDSYGDETGEWPELVISALNLQGQAFNLCVSGSGFVSSGQAQYLFITQLQNFTTDRDTITDIVICGGLNDSGSNDPQSSLYVNVQDNMAAFAEYAKTNFPNADISLGYIGNGVDGGQGSLIAGRVYSARQACRYIYYTKAAALGWKILENVEYALTGSVGLLSSDGVHPSTFGNQYLATAISMAILNGGATYTYPKFSMFATSGDLTGNIFYEIYNQTAHIEFEQLTKLMTNANFKSGDSMELATLYGVWFNEIVALTVPINISGFTVNGTIEPTHIASAYVAFYHDKVNMMIMSGNDEFTGSGAIYIFPNSVEFNSMIMA